MNHDRNHEIQLIDWAKQVRKDRDGSLYGSLWVVATCLGVLG